VGRPTAAQWLDLLDEIGRDHDERPVDLLAIDSLANLMPLRSENDAGEMLRAVAPLQRLTQCGVAVLLSHHPRKGPKAPGQAARGSGALSGFVDIVVEMHRVCRNMKDRRRRLNAWSRYAATPPTWAIEWTADGLDYLGLGPSAEPDYERGWPVLHALLENAEKPLTRRAIHQAWPDTAAAPAPITLWKWLTRAVRERRVEQHGDGRPKDPYTYHLPGMLDKWQEKLREQLLRQLGMEPEAAVVTDRGLSQRGSST
jgi:hypothetical protein